MSTPTAPTDAASKKRERENVPEAKGTESKSTPMNYDVFEEEFQNLLASVKKNEVTAIDWEYRGLNEAGVNALAAAILEAGDKSKLEIIKLGYNKFGDAAGKVLASALLTLKHLRELYLPDSNLTADGIGAICAALQVPKTIIHFDISRNRPDAKGCGHIGELLKASQVQVLDLCMSNLTAASIEHQSFVEGLKANQSLHTLILHNNKLMDAGFEKLLAAIEGTNISRLDVAVNGLTDTSCAALAKTIKGEAKKEEAKKGTKLSTLELCSNSITQVGTKDLAAAITNNHTINHLDLINNDVGVEGKEALAAMLKSNPFITFLNFGTIDDGINALIERNKIYAVRMMFMRGQYSRESSVHRSFFSNVLYDHNILRVVFGFVHDDKALKTAAAPAAAAPTPAKS